MFNQEFVTDVLEEFSINRTLLRRRLPFLSVFARVIDEENLIKMPDGKTMGVTTKNLYYSEDFSQALTPRQFRFLVMHELYHLVLGHPKRRDFVKDYDHRLMNIAQDLRINSSLYMSRKEYADKGINYELIDMGCHARLPGMDPKYPPDAIRTRPLPPINEKSLCINTIKRYMKMTSEEIYEELKKDIKQQLQQQGGGSGDGEPQDGNSQDGQGQDEEGQPGQGQPGDEKGQGQDGESQDGKPQQRQGSQGQQEKKDPDQKDKGSVDRGEDKDREDNGDNTHVGAKKGRSKVQVAGNEVEIDDKGHVIDDGSDNHSQLNNEQDTTDEQVLADRRAEDFRMAERLQDMTPEGCGSMPGDLKGELFKMKEVKINWTKAYEKMLKELTRGEATYKRVQRWGIHSSTYVPSESKSKVMQYMVFAGIDTSGSISKKLLETFFGALYKISKRYEIHESCEIGFWDHKMGNHYSLAESVKALSKGNVRFDVASGGTDVMCYFNHLKERSKGSKKINPQVLLVFTDGHFSMPRPEDIPKDWHKKILWVVWGGYNKQLDTLGIGKVVHIEIPKV